jgi:hypothetical protein
MLEKPETRKSLRTATKSKGRSRNRPGICLRYFAGLCPPRCNDMAACSMDRMVSNSNGTRLWRQYEESENQSSTMCSKPFDGNPKPVRRTGSNRFKRPRTAPNGHFLMKNSPDPEVLRCLNLILVARPTQTWRSALRRGFACRRRGRRAPVPTLSGAVSPLWASNCKQGPVKELMNNFRSLAVQFEVCAGACFCFFGGRVAKSSLRVIEQSRIARMLWS